MGVQAILDQSSYTDLYSNLQLHTYNQQVKVVQALGKVAICNARAPWATAASKMGHSVTALLKGKEVVESKHYVPQWTLAITEEDKDEGLRRLGAGGEACREAGRRKRAR